MGNDRDLRLTLANALALTLQLRLCGDNEHRRPIGSKEQPGTTSKVGMSIGCGVGGVAASKRSAEPGISIRLIIAITEWTEQDQPRLECMI
jgi:hypothetical protein